MRNFLGKVSKEFTVILIAAVLVGIGLYFIVVGNESEQEQRSRDNIQYITDVVRGSQADGNKNLAKAITALLEGNACILLIEPQDRTEAKVDDCVEDALKTIGE